jgi:signal transduction histidine kinase
VVSQAPLLPQTLTRGARIDSAFRYRVLTPGGLLLAGDREPLQSPFAATGVLSSMWGDIRAEVALDESVAGQLIIGGLPRSRLPLVLVLLGLSTLLVAVAVVQLRRDRELTRLREDFVTGVSHELRTPLAQIRLFAETLRLGRVRSDTERQRSLEIIDRESRRLGHLVDNLLAVNQAGRGALRISPRDTDVSRVLREAVEGFAPLAALRGAIVALDAPDAVRAVVDADAVRQIALNLLDNAVKFGPEGQTVRVRLARDGAVLRLAVEDQGPGVPDDGASRVFEPFVRLPARGSGQPTGTGLGLSLVRDLAALHRGEARVERAPGGGARFVVELPTAGPTPGRGP